MKALLSPVPAVLLSVLLSVGAFYLWFQTQVARAVSLIAAQKAETAEVARPEKPWDFWTPEVENLAKELASRRETLARRESEVAVREARVATERQEVDAARAQVEKLRAEVDARLAKLDTQLAAREQSRLRALVATYGKLTPALAVALLKQTEDDEAARILAAMKPDVAVALLEELSRDPGPDNQNVKRVAVLTRLMGTVGAPASGGR